MSRVGVAEDEHADWKTSVDEGLPEDNCSDAIRSDVGQRPAPEVFDLAQPRQVAGVYTIKVFDWWTQETSFYIGETTNDDTAFPTIPLRSKTHYSSKK